MRFVILILAVLAIVFGLVCLGYAIIVPYSNLPADSLNAAAGVVYQKGTYYGVLAIALFSLAGLAIAGSARLRSV